MIKSETVENTMSFKKKEAWQSFRGAVEGFLSNKKDPNFQKLVARLIRNFSKLGKSNIFEAAISLFTPGFFQNNLGDFSEENGERFHQDIESIKRKYQGRWDSAMMGDNVGCFIRRDTSVHKRKARSAIYF